MPTLLLMRHAKSDWSDADCPDHDRPLKARGKRDAPRMGLWLVKQLLVPDLVVTSSAKRARKTAKRVAKALPAAIPIVTREDLYHASVRDWMDVLTDLPAESKCVLCIGHNPGLETLLTHLTGRYERMPTATIARLEVTGEDWPGLAQDHAGIELAAVWRPKEIELDSE